MHYVGQTLVFIFNNILYKAECFFVNGVSLSPRVVREFFFLLLYNIILISLFRYVEKENAVYTSNWNLLKVQCVRFIPRSSN